MDQWRNIQWAGGSFLASQKLEKEAFHKGIVAIEHFKPCKECGKLTGCNCKFLKEDFERMRKASKNSKRVCVKCKKKINFLLTDLCPDCSSKED